MPRLLRRGRSTTAALPCSLPSASSLRSCTLARMQLSSLGCELFSLYTKLEWGGNCTDKQGRSTAAQSDCEFGHCIQLIIDHGLPFLPSAVFSYWFSARGFWPFGAFLHLASTTGQLKQGLEVDAKRKSPFSSCRLLSFFCDACMVSPCCQASHKH